MRCSHLLPEEPKYSVDRVNVVGGFVREEVNCARVKHQVLNLTIVGAHPFFGHLDCSLEMIKDGVPTIYSRRTNAENPANSLKSSIQIGPRGDCILPPIVVN
jgi:hypothetical protein